MLRDHSPIVIDKFNGLWRRGTPETTPLDHFSESNNIRHIGTSDFSVRPGVGISQSVAVPLSDVRRLYNYPTPTGNTIIALTYDEGADEGNIYHVVDPATVFGPLLTLEGMRDFAFLPYAGRGYISPIGYYTDGDLNVEKGLEDEFLYVYMGDGTAARTAAGAAPTGNMTIANGAAGFTDPGLHIFAVVYETDSGYLSPPGAAEAFTTAAGSSVSFGNIPTSGDPSVTKRHIVATKVIPTYNGDTLGYQFFFIPNATINDNVTTFINNVSFFDADLLEDASHLLDNYSTIPAGATLSLYHNRLVLGATFDDPSIYLVSAIGEPEAIDQINGIMIVPPNGDPITNGAELRDIFYGFKRAQTVAFIDNGDEPATWPMTTIDNALGTSIHGIATVLESGKSSVDFLIVVTYSGIILFNGRYMEQALSWKIEDYWSEEDKSEYRRVQLIHDPTSFTIYIVTPAGNLLTANFGNGMTPKAIRWEPWTFPFELNSVALVNIDEIILGANL